MSSPSTAPSRELAEAFKAVVASTDFFEEVEEEEFGFVHGCRCTVPLFNHASVNLQRQHPNAYALHVNGCDEAEFGYSIAHSSFRS